MLFSLLTLAGFAFATRPSVTYVVKLSSQLYINIVLIGCQLFSIVRMLFLYPYVGSIPD
jgi:hypothetical protein